MEDANVVQFLEKSPKSLTEELFNEPAACLAVFQYLSPLCRHFIVRLVYVEVGVPFDAVYNWFAASEKGAVDVALRQMDQLQIALIDFAQRVLQLAPNFQRGLATTLAGGSAPWAAGSLHREHDAAILDDLAKKRWEAVLSYLVRTTPIERDVRENLMAAELVTTVDGMDTITPRGFQFVLCEQRTQLWAYIICFLRRFKGNVAQALSFIFKLALNLPGEVYSSKGLTAPPLAVLKHFSLIGLVYLKEGAYCTTRLASLLAQESHVVDDPSKRFVIVETNNCVYGYSESDLRVAILGLFTQMKNRYRLPNFASGRLTRLSLRQAFAKGITALQIINFLQTHAHPQMHARDRMPFPPLPATISDQILLWEQECCRIKVKDGTMYRNFSSQGDFDYLHAFAASANAVIYSDPRALVLVVKSEAHALMKQHWSTRPNKA